MRRARSIAAAAAGVGLILAGPFVGYWTLGLFALTVLNLVTLEWRIARSERPERVVAGSLIFVACLMATGLVLSGGARSPLLPWMIMPVAVAAARFRRSVVVVGALVTGAAMVLICVAVDPAATIAHPTLLIVSLVLLVAIVAVTTALAGAELQYRGESTLDSLTGLLNRNGLQARFAELREQAVLLDKPVCLIAADLDNFKEINDTYGHGCGDAVLRDAAYEMRKTLRSFELLYRLGGEEFLLLLPGIDRDAGEEVAERMRAAVEAARPGDIAVTISLGVSAARGDEIGYEPLFGAADAALYRAKAAGRNRVAVAADGADSALEPVGAALTPPALPALIGDALPERPLAEPINR